MLNYRQIFKNIPIGRFTGLLTEEPALGCSNQIRHIQKHWNPKFKKLRTQKVLKVKLIDFQELNKPPEDLTKEEIRSKLKEKGLLPERPWSEKSFFVSATGGVFEPYVPPEGDGKVSVITSEGAKQKLEFIEKKSKSMLATRKIRNFEEDFEFEDFLKEAQDIYIKSHEAMTNKDRDKLSIYVTERAYPEVAHNIADKTIDWKFVESIQPPKVVHVRCTDVITKENIFAQITVRFHSRQILVVYDKFGRLLHGNTDLPKDVLEYVVFERHMANKYGRWRIHDKIIPNWMPPKEPSKTTYIQPEDTPETTLPAETEPNKQVAANT